MLGLALWSSYRTVGGSTPSPCHRVVSLDKKLYSTLSLSTKVYKKVQETFHSISAILERGKQGTKFSDCMGKL